jgi:hypothetical protein
MEYKISMPKKRPVVTILENILPKALIIGGEHIADYLGNKLIDSGCEVVKEENYSSKLGHFDYIFQFDNFDAVDSGLKKYLKDEGKFLFIETLPEENITSSAKIKILRIGDPLLWSPQELIEKILKTIFLTRDAAVIDVRRKPKATPAVDYVPKIPERPSKRDHSPLVVKKSALSFKKIIGLSFLFLLLLIMVSGGFIAWRLMLLRDAFGEFRTHIASSNWQQSFADLKKTHQELGNIRKIYAVSSQILFPIRDVSFFKDIGAFISVSDSLLTDTEELLSSLPNPSAENSSFPVFGNGVSQADFLRIEGKIREMQQTVSLANEKLKGSAPPFFPKDSFFSLLSFVQNKLGAANTIMPLLEKIIFTKEKKVYLVLFQNNMELRPTGGFIGSYALLTIQDGKILDFKIEDVYTADGQLKGHVDPPMPIRKYLSQPHWFLRDSNFDPDFAISADRAAWFLQKEMGVNVDGIVGVNLFFAQDLLSATGSLNLADFNNEEIRADNFFEKAHEFSQKDFFPGSTQKKDFLSSVATALFTKLGGGRSMIWFEVLPKVKKSLEEKNIIIAAKDESLQQMIEEKGFGGRMTLVKCVLGEKPCYADYLSVNEANLGVNKVNYFINKSVTLEKTINANGEILSSVTLSYENSATNEIYPDATYVNYLRLFTPSGSVLKSATLNNVPISPADLTVEAYGSDKTVFGFLVRITSGGKGTVKVMYALPSPISANISSYQLFFQKQPGDKTSPLVVSILFPDNLKLSPTNFQSTTSHQGEIYYTTDTSVDRIFAMDVGH